jgi:hypothetical protein
MVDERTCGRGQVKKEKLQAALEAPLSLLPAISAPRERFGAAKTLDVHRWATAAIVTELQFINAKNSGENCKTAVKMSELAASPAAPHQGEASYCVGGSVGLRKRE